MSRLNEITKTLGYQYRLWKTGEKKKDGNKAEFFELADAELEERGLSTKSVTVYGPTQDEATARCKEYYPIFKILETIEGEDGRYLFILEELAKFKPYTHINDEDGQVYKRVVSAGSTVVDLDRIAEEDPDLHDEITERVTERVLKDLGKLTPSQLGKLQEYVYEKTPTVKLAAPRKAKEEELNEGTDDREDT